MTEVLTHERFYDRADPEAVFRLALPAAPTCGFLLDAREALIEYVDSLTADWQERGLSPADLAGNLRAATERLIEISLLLPDAPEDEDEPDGQDADTDAAPHRLGILGEDRAFDLALHSGALLQEAINPFLASSALSGTEKVYFMLTLAEDALRMASSNVFSSPMIMQHPAQRIRKIGRERAVQKSSRPCENSFGRRHDAIFGLVSRRSGNNDSRGDPHLC